MTAVVIRPLHAGEEDLFESLPDPLPQLRKIAYADGLATGGYSPDRTWVALDGGRVVARAAWVLPPGSVGLPWLERFDVAAPPPVGAGLLRAAHEAFGGPRPYYASAPAHWRRRPDVAAVLAAPMTAARLAGLVERGERLRLTWQGEPVPARTGRYTVRPARDAGEVAALVSRVGRPDVTTGAETAMTVAGVDLATDPLAWLAFGTTTWLVGCDSGVPVGVIGAAGDACYPLAGYLGLLDEGARGFLLAAAVEALAADGAREVVADVDAHRVDVLADLERTGFRQVRSRVVFAPVEPDGAVAVSS